MPHRAGLILHPSATAVVAAALLLGGCAGAPPLSGPAAGAAKPPPPLPERDATVYRVDRSESQIRIRVYRAGPLADVGHNHVITSSDIHGCIYLHHRLADSGFRLTIPVTGLNVDPPAARAQEGKGFEGRLDKADRRGTRKHMLGASVLDAAKYPVITLRSIAVAGPPWYPRITVRVTLHGHSRDYVVPTAIARNGQRLVATGGLQLQQTRFGIRPYSVLGGGLRVANRIDVAFHLVAVPAGDS